MVHTVRVRVRAGMWLSALSATYGVTMFVCDLRVKIRHSPRVGAVDFAKFRENK